jgi:RNA polymerase sigma-70 factor (ECF subfamily)
LSLTHAKRGYCIVRSVSDHTEDLALAAACLAGDATALAAFERDHLAPAAGVLRRAGYDVALVDDAIQLLRYRLLVVTPERGAKLATYSGRGSLAGWLRITALRQARALLGPRNVTFDSARDGAAASLDSGILAREQGPRIREIVRDAVAGLAEKPREALRLEVVEGMPHHEIAALWNVHRTTVVRWIEEARSQIAAAVRRALRDELAVGPATADSLLRSLAGVELSLASAFRQRP